MSRHALPVITRQQLALYNGTDKPAVWIAYRGLVYDVSASRLWLGGRHYEHWAGQDLTDELSEAPHTADKLDRFRVVAKLAAS
ncbi:MAG TPA: cytochrome b5 [Flammeovirgaceae bacterium]|nr:cytochrome b5 [Flammeovirgaceae bacterium]